MRSRHERWHQLAGDQHDGGDLSNTSLKQRKYDALQRFYYAEAIVDQLPLQPTPGCNGGTKTDPTTCFLADKKRIEADANQAAAQQAAEQHAAAGVPTPAPAPAPTPAAAGPSKQPTTTLSLPASATLASAAAKPFGRASPVASPPQIVQTIDVPPVCKMQVVDNLSPPPSKPTSPPTENDLLNTLQGYVNGLSAVTNKTDATNYDAAAKTLSTSVQTASTAVGALAGGVGAAVGPIAGAIVKIGADAAKQILQYRRYEALKAAALAECVPVHNISVALSVLMSSDWDVARAADGNVLSLLQIATTKRLGSDDMKAVTVLAGAAVEDVRTNGATNPGNALTKIYESHNQLVQDLVDGKGESDAFRQLLNSLAGDVSTLKTVTQTKAAAGTLAVTTTKAQ